MPTLIPVSEADRLLKELTFPIRGESTPLEQATGRILLESILADRDLPPFDRVMMDGFAIRHSDLSKCNEFTPGESALAGMPVMPFPDTPNAAVEVMTGSPLPTGADTVIPVEDVEKGNGTIRLLDDANPERGQFVHRRGSDYPKGTTLVKEGTLLRSIEVGIAASCGHVNLSTSQRPTVSIFSTGNELVPVDQTPGAHQIRQSNAHAVRAALASQPVDIQQVSHFSDDVEEESQRLAAAVEMSDVIIISGAVSKGRLDWIPAALDAIGEKIFHGISQRPGKPMGVWTTHRGCTVFALPGNPVSTLVCTHRYVIPFIRNRLGLNSASSPTTLDEAFSFDRPLTLFLPVTRLDESRVKACPVNNSGDYAGLTQSDGFIELTASENHWTAGSKAPFFPWK